MEVMNKYRHIIFDIDGTLLDTESAILQSLKDTVAEILQKDIPVEELKFALGIPGEVTLHRLGISDARTANRKWNEYLLRYKSSIRLFKGIPALLASLKVGGYSLGIVTSKNRNEYNEDFEMLIDSRIHNELNIINKDIICAIKEPNVNFVIGDFFILFI